MNTLNNSNIFEESETIYDLDSDELDFLIKYRKLTQKDKEKLLEHIENITE